MVTPEEYNSLPPSIQKKYFSSVERLRIAQQGAAEKRKKQPIKETCLSPKPSMDSVRPKTANGFKPSALSHCRKSSTTRSDADVDEEQALRFLALPDKVKRSHFTQEELALLTESSERALGSPSALADDGYRRRLPMDRKGSMCSSHYQSSTTSDEFHDDTEKDWFEMETDSVTSFEGYDMDILKMYSRGRQGSVSSTLSSLPAFPPRDSSRPNSHRKSLPRKRATSLAPLPLPPPALRPAVPPLPPPTALKTLNKMVYSPGPQTPPAENAPSTKFYKDTHARSRLREYLASPEKFDEALEFGFPTERRLPERSTSLTSSVDQSLQTEMEELSLVNSRDEEEESRSISPQTPSMVNDGFHPNITPHSPLDSGLVLPFTPGKGSVRNLSPNFDGREMTLRMTLTRPDLRAPEEELYAFQRKQVSGVDVEVSDPLALQSLSVCDDHSGQHGAFAVSRSSGGGFKKVWKGLRGRPYQG